MEPTSTRLTKAYVHLDRLTRNLELLRKTAGVPLWPVIKANAYGHDAQAIAAHLARQGFNTFGVADVAEAVALADAGIRATFVVLSATLPTHSETLAAYGCEPVVCTLEMATALDRAARKLGKRISVHLGVDTGMGRIGVRPEAAGPFLEQLKALPGLEVRGIMSHFPRADEADKTQSLEQLETFRRIAEKARRQGVAVCHIANSAAIFDIPGSAFDAVRPGIAMYGLRPSTEMQNPAVARLEPVLEWKSRIVFLKEVPAETGLSYGHDFRTARPSLIATVPIGYGDGLSRRLSGRMEMLVNGVRCPQVGRITMDMSLIDVTALRGRVKEGDQVVIIGRSGEETIGADDLAQRSGTINYEIVTGIAQRVPRVIMGG